MFMLAAMIYIAKLTKRELVMPRTGWKLDGAFDLSQARAQPRFKIGGSESGEARIEGAKRPRFEGEARIEGEARERAGEGVWGGGSVSPSPENFWNFELQIVPSGLYLNQKS